MANPFASLFGGSPNTSGQPAGGGAGIAAPAPQNVQPAPVPGQNPISGLLTSDAPGIFGLLGRAAGNPTSAEMMYRRLGNQQAEGLKGLTERLAKGMPQQQAILDFMNNDPRAMEFFGSSADPVGAMRGALSTLAPPVHTGVVGQSVYDTYTGKIIDSAPANLGPGDQRLDGQGNVIAQNLPADVQSQQAFMKAAGMSASDAEDLSRAAAVAKSTTDVGAKQTALRHMVQSGAITQAQMDKISSGVVQINPYFDAAGNQMGNTYTDMTDFLAGGGRDPSKIHTTIIGVNNNDPSRAVPGGAKIDQFGVPLGVHPSPDIILGAGPIGKLADHLSAYASIIDPKHLSAEFYNDAHDQLESVVTQLGDLVQTNGRFQGPYKELQNMVEEQGYTGSPIQQGIAFRNLIRMGQRTIQVNNAQIADMSGTVTKPAKEAASVENGKVRQLLAMLPDPQALEATIEKARNGAGGAKEAAQTFGKHIGETIQGVTDNLKGAANAVGDTANQVSGAVGGPQITSGTSEPTSFKSLSDAKAAAKAGTLTPGGDGLIHVVINGHSGTLRPKGKK